MPFVLLTQCILPAFFTLWNAFFAAPPKPVLGLLVNFAVVPPTVPDVG